MGESRKFRSPSGSIFTATLVNERMIGDNKFVVAEISGKGYYSGTCTFTLEEDDVIGQGFLLH